MKGLMGEKKCYAQSVYGAEPTTMDQLANCVIQIINSHRDTSLYPRGMASIKTTKCVGLSWQLAHFDNVSITHCSPEGFPRYNWYSKAKQPSGYPGWSGRVWVRYAEDSVRFGSDAFERTLTYTGTGGGGHYDGPWRNVASKRFNRYGRGRDLNAYPEPAIFSWGYKIFDADWPEIAEIKAFKKAIKKWERTVLKRYNEQAMLAKLEERWIPPVTHLPHPTHDFLWECPETAAKDAEFLASLSTI
jgi:hypothetical protein